ncbi:Copia protein (Gag-int-pol protein) [Abeliophyllum distichum]|uniref:Copia protein (Gag-int-pol protein) n=1 Tax=Abeliophyllum distichum TaxID=126358 RepID=A0ABD1Q4X1_9LAMI
MTKTPFTGKGVRAADILELVHTNVCGLMSTDARGGFSYFITFTDDHSRYGFIYLMKFKHKAFEKFKEFKQEVEREVSRSKVDLEEVKKTTNIDQLDEPIVEPAFDEAHIGSGKPSVPEDIAALHKSSKGHSSS